MRNFNRTFWRHKSEEKARTSLTGECAQAQEFLTAAFDGEAGGEALAAAQRHLTQCPSCAQRWEQWESARILLRSLPVPAVPPSLLARVLLACRLLSARSGESSPPFSSNDISARRVLTDYIEAIEDEAMRASLTHILTPVPVPTDLQRKILQATTGTSQKRNLSLTSLLCQWLPAWPVSRSATRWGMGLAVPALATWLFFAGQTEYPLQPPVTSSFSVESQTKNVTPANERKLNVSAPVPRSNRGLKPLKNAVIDTVKDMPRVAVNSVLPRPVPTEEHDLRQAPAIRHATPILVSNIPEKKTVSTASNAPLRRVRQHAVPAVDIIENHSPNLVLAASRRSISRLPLHAEFKISHPETTFAPRLAKLSDSDFDEAFIAVSTARDNRPAEFGRAFDEYRASLLADKTDTEDDWEEL